MPTRNILTKNFAKSFTAYQRKGGPGRIKNIQKVNKALSFWPPRDDSGLQPTAYGEKRIANRFKYELSSRYEI